MINSLIKNTPLISILLFKGLDENNDLKVKSTKKKASRFSIENNPNYWMVVKGSNSDTTFYTLKNKKTGTKLSNRFYSKQKANKELKKLRSILSK